jgi:formate-dependent nitrite reductase membrane component NrfD
VYACSRIVSSLLDLHDLIVFFLLCDFQVCEEERWGDQVYLRAVSYMDRFLSVQCIHRNQIQLLGVVCMILSTKFSGFEIKVMKFILLTENSVTPEMVLVSAQPQSFSSYSTHQCLYKVFVCLLSSLYGL